MDSGGTFNYVTDGDTPASSVLSDSAAVYTPGLSERRGTTSKFYHGDRLGSTRGITNNSQTVTDSTLYDAFGMTVSHSGSTPNPFGFVGAKQYQQDSDSGLMLLGHRYYDPSIGRFLSQDPIRVGSNGYAYCENNPLKYADPQGTTPAWLTHFFVWLWGITHRAHGGPTAGEPKPPEPRIDPRPAPEPPPPPVPHRIYDPGGSTEPYPGPAPENPRLPGNYGPGSEPVLPPDDTEFPYPPCRGIKSNEWPPEPGGGLRAYPIIIAQPIHDVAAPVVRGWRKGIARYLDENGDWGSGGGGF